MAKANDLYWYRYLVMLHGMMRRSIYRRNDAIKRSPRQDITSCVPHLPSVLRTHYKLESADTYSTPPIRRIHCSSFKQYWSRISSPLSYHIRLLKCKFRRPCSQPTIMCNWTWDVSHVQHQLQLNTFRFGQQSRCFSSNNNEGRSKSKRQQNYELSGKRIIADPFVTLGILRSPTLKYSSVKSTFLKIAMKYHPDTTVKCSDAERESNKDLFVSARKAFEAIVADPDGIAILKTEAHDYVEEEEDFEEWFKNETGYDMPFMDAATMKEVAEMTDTVGGGLDRDGGMWTLARMVANTVKAGGDSKSVLQLDAGIIRDRSIDGILRRKRKR